MTWCETHGVDYVFGLAKNARLIVLIQDELAGAATQCATTERPARVFTNRTTAATFRANQQRLYCSSVAYVLLAALRRLGLAGTALAKAQCTTIRLTLLKIGARGRVAAPSPAYPRKTRAHTRRRCRCRPITRPPRPKHSPFSPTENLDPAAPPRFAPSSRRARRVGRARSVVRPSGYAWRFSVIHDVRPLVSGTHSVGHRPHKVRRNPRLLDLCVTAHSGGGRRAGQPPLYFEDCGG